MKPTVDTIIEKYVEAVGGKANLSKIKSRTILANRIEPNGTVEPEEILQKANKLLIVTKYPQAVVSEAFDGVRVWKRANTNNIPLKPDEIEQIKRNAQFFAFADLKSVYPKMDFRMIERIDGREVYLITAMTADNQRERLYFDINTGFLVRRMASTPTILGAFQYQVDYADYKDFGGVKLPTNTRHALPNISWIRKILEVKNNAAIEDAKFNPSTK
jgi:hypothetical protein